MERTVTAINAAAPQERKIRTAAYCRVSSDSADQLHLFSAQVRYYTRLIGDNECMELVDIYADEAQSGELDYKFSELYAELYSVKDELEEMQSGASALDGDMLNEMREVVTGLKNHPVEYDDKVVRQLIDCIKVMSADTIKICFKDGTVTETAL